MRDLFLVASDFGDPDTWPEAFAYVGLGLCALIGWIAWLKLRFHDEPEDPENEAADRYAAAVTEYGNRMTDANEDA